MLRRLFAILLLIALAFATPAIRAREPLTGPLGEYVAAKDDSYAWLKRSEGSVLTCQYKELILTSQIWRDIPWKHQLFLLKPAQVDPAARHGLLKIGRASCRERG